MPKPRDGESQSDFVSRCVPALIDEGRDKDQAVAICHSMYGQKNRPFSITKQADGRYRWFAVWSNPYRDRDHPPEILTEAAHIDYAKAVNKGLWDYPDLWLYHIPGSKCGTSDFIAYDIDNRLSVASGLFDVGKELVAEALNSTQAKLKVSHGFPRNEVQREDGDPTIITRFRSKEISPLPADAAANELTGFRILGGNMNLIPENAKERLRAIFKNDEETVEQVADALDLMGDEAKEANLEFKEVDGETEVEDAEEVEGVEVEAKETDEVDDTEVESDEEKEVEEVDTDTLDRKEVEDAVKMIVGALDALLLQVKELQSANSELQSQVASLSDRVAATERSDEEKAAEMAARTPRLALDQIVANSIIGKEEVLVDGRKARHEGPQETKNEHAVDTGHPALDGIITSIIGDPASVRGVDPRQISP